MNTTDIIKNLSKMDTSELRMVCREMNCKTGSKTQMIARLVAPLLKGKSKFQMGKNLNDDTLIYMIEYLDFDTLKNLISSETDDYVKKLLISNIKFNNETIREAVREYLKDRNKATQIYGDIGSWNVSNVTDMRELFFDAINFNQPIGDWDVSNVTDMRHMFCDATSFNNGEDADTSSAPLNWDVSNVTNMRSMFNGAKSFNQPIGNWDASNVTDMSYMFWNAPSFNQPIGAWNVSNVRDMGFMFDRATSFNQPIGDWDVSSGTDFSYMFDRATSFNRENAPWAPVYTYGSDSDEDDY
jgi:surface protein